jgi:pimeloyl-ACP methyl ester carboxylesterase
MAQSLETAGSGQTAHDFAEVNGVELDYAHAGDGPLIVFLHGFPQCWYQFRHQLGEFSRDHLAVAPDLRGYNLSSKPDDVHAYTTCTLVEDVRQLVERLGYERFVLVGHDVGGATHWLAEERPELVNRGIREHLARVATAGSAAAAPARP